MSTFHSLHYHITFSTKHRKPWIKVDWRDRMHAYLGGITQDVRGVPLCIGGIEDHVHLLVGLKTTHCISDFMRELKKSSSRWIHEEIGFEPFQWQDGYAVFSLSPSAIPEVRRYIENQAEHHRTRTFREELVAMLDRAGVNYDAKYLD
ncbi:IS200/IS605 family transposase [Rhodopirellula sp. JC740]|uniref:IS200/IS605 family transposase n=1 Tax=Rhodopirellula halodulae TaxID=2894198 RepID=A0ABS8NJG6_9BACT|nr:IS200/IS605 family transposase [Rhodopirellula sp. JC740]MCC9643700.1 IS200/IS605 family transposase [Rhodopirellula sp. JC740]